MFRKQERGGAATVLFEEENQEEPYETRTCGFEGIYR